MNLRRTCASVQIITGLIAILLVAQSCKDNAVQQAAKALRDTAKAMEVFQDTVIEANKEGLIPDDTTRQILIGTLQVNATGQRAATLLRLMDETGRGNSEAVVMVLDEVIRQLGDLAGQLRITDEKLRTQIAATIQLAQASLNTARLVMAGSAQ